MIFKKISGLAFGIAFLMAIVIFTGYGRAYLPIFIAKIIFLTSGAVAFLLNVIFYKKGKHAQTFTLFYWVGSIVLFTGFAFKIFHWPFATIIILIGVGILGISFILPNKNKSIPKDEDLLDDF